MKHVLIGFAVNVSGVDADKVAKELESLQRKHGSLTPELILKDAQNSHREMHKCFDWEDTEAAQKWRLHQSRQLVRAIRVRSEEIRSTSPRPVYVRTEKVYRSVSQVVNREDWYISAMRQLQSKIEQAERAARELAAAAAREHPDDIDRMARINMALEAFRACTKAVEALH